MYLHTRNIAPSPSRLPDGTHRNRYDVPSSFTVGIWGLVSVLPKKSRPFPCGSERDNLPRKKAQALHPFPFPSQENDTASRQVFWLGSPRDPCAFPVSPSGVFPSRAPLTAAGQHRHRTCFSAIEALFPISSSAQKAGGRAPSLALTDFFHIISE